MTVKPFKVIVCGGGPIGLVVAHALSKANIDYVVLERQDDIVVDLGASTIVWQSTLRIMSQFGILDRFREVGVPITKTVMRAAADQPRYGVISLDDWRRE